MKTLWYIAKKDLLQIVKDRNGLIFMLLVPLVLITIVGSALGTIYGNNNTQTSITVALNNQDLAPNAFIGKSIISALKVNTKQLLISVQEYSTPAQVRARVMATSDAANVGIVIPEGASQQLQSELQQQTVPQNLVQFYTLPNANDARIVIVQNIVQNIVRSLLTGNAGVVQVERVCQQPGNHCAPGSVNTAAINAAIANANNQTDQAIESLSAGQAATTNTFDQVLPGYAIFFSLFGLNAVAATILKEKEDGTFRRLLIAPIQKYALLGGKMLAQFIVTMAQLSILFLVGYIVFKVNITNWPALILLLIGTSFAATGLGMLLVSVVRTRAQLNPIVSLVVLLTSAIGGSWWPLYIEPGWLQQFAKIGITFWAIEGLNNTILFGRSFTQILPDILGLLVYGLICFALALRFFRFQEKVAVAR